jgi:hypothetical protein
MRGGFNKMNIDKIVYYKETTLSDGKKIIERGCVDYEHIEKALKERAKIINSKTWYMNIINRKNNGTQEREL